MSNHRQTRRRQAVKRRSARRGEKTIFSATVFILLAAGLLMGFNLFTARAQPEAALTATPSTPEIHIPAPQTSPVPTVEAGDGILAKQVVYSGYVGLVSGHKGYDPGAVCADGLTEAEVNYVIALEVAELLARRGVQSDVLDEFDPRLTGLEADALVSIHSDSCSVPGLTGFKVARVTESAIPEAEDVLVECLNQEYAAYTGLPQHLATITDGMTNYHAFSEINSFTPGAIIETGFMLEDRFLLEQRPKIVARGIAAGILCFLDHQGS